MHRFAAFAVRRARVVRGHAEQDYIVSRSAREQGRPQARTRSHRAGRSGRIRQLHCRMNLVGSGLAIKDDDGDDQATRRILALVLMLYKNSMSPPSSCTKIRSCSSGSA